MPQPEHAKSAPQKPPKLILPIVVFILAMYVFCFDAGKVSMDHLQHIDTMISIWMSFGGVWTVTNILKAKKQTRERVTLFSIVALLLLPAVIGGFLAGRAVQYPAESRALVEEIGLHLQDMKGVKEQ